MMDDENIILSPDENDAILKYMFSNMSEMARSVFFSKILELMRLNKSGEITRLLKYRYEASKEKNFQKRIDAAVEELRQCGLVFGVRNDVISDYFNKKEKIN